MNKFCIIFLSLITFIVTISNTNEKSNISCPNWSSKVDLSKLNNFLPNNKSEEIYCNYAGQLSLNDPNNSEYFYWLFSTTENIKTTKPLILYIGDGNISSIPLIFSNIGPLTLINDNKFPLDSNYCELDKDLNRPYIKLKERDPRNTLLSIGHLLIIDQPAVFGFSISSQITEKYTELQIIELLITFIAKIQEKYELLGVSELYIMGEEFMATIMTNLSIKLWNRMTSNIYITPWKFTGIIINNGILNIYKSQMRMLNLSKTLGFIAYPQQLAIQSYQTSKLPKSINNQSTPLDYNLLSTFLGSLSAVNEQSVYLSDNSACNYFYKTIDYFFNHNDSSSAHISNQLYVKYPGSGRLWDLVDKRKEYLIYSALGTGGVDTHNIHILLTQGMKIMINTGPFSLPSLYTEVYQWLNSQDFSNRKFLDSEDLLSTAYYTQNDNITVFTYPNKGNDLSNNSQLFIRAISNYILGGLEDNLSIEDNCRLFLKDCSGQGVCKNEKCICESGYYGVFCDIQIHKNVRLPHKFTLKPREFQYFEINLPKNSPQSYTLTNKGESSPLLTPFIGISKPSDPEAVLFSSLNWKILLHKQLPSNNKKILVGVQNRNLIHELDLSFNIDLIFSFEQHVFGYTLLGLSLLSLLFLILFLCYFAKVRKDDSNNKLFQNIMH